MNKNIEKEWQEIHKRRTKIKKKSKQIAQKKKEKGERDTRKSLKIQKTSNKHCQRHNGPEGWVHLTKVTCWGHIMSSYIEFAQISSSES